MEPFRNDHDATLARADALGIELDLTRQELADAHIRIDALEHRVPAPPPVQTPPRSWPVMVGLVIGAVIIVLAGMLFVRPATRTAAPDPDDVAAPVPEPALDPGAGLSCPLEEPYVP